MSMKDDLDRDFVIGMYQMMYTEEEEVYDDITHLAAAALEVPFTFFALMTSGTHWVKSGCGVGQVESPLEMTFCSQIIECESALVLEDASKDERFAAHPYVVGGPKIRGYLGIPIQGYGGMIIGSLCGFDAVPRAWTEREIDHMKRLARQVEIHLENRRKHYALLSSKSLDPETRAKIAAFTSEQQVMNRRVIHDMRNVLSTVSTNIYFMDGDVDPIERREIIEDVAMACDKGNRIISELEVFQTEVVEPSQLDEDTDIDFVAREVNEAV